MASLSSKKAVDEYLLNQKENITNMIKQSLAVGDIYKRENLQVIYIYINRLFVLNSFFCGLCSLYLFLLGSMGFTKNNRWAAKRIVTGNLLFVFCRFQQRRLSKKLKIQLMNSNVKNKIMMKNVSGDRSACVTLLEKQISSAFSFNCVGYVVSVILITCAVCDFSLDLGEER